MRGRVGGGDGAPRARRAHENTSYVTATSDPIARPGFGLLRIVRLRPRLFTSTAIGAVIALALTAVPHWSVALRLLIGWDVAVALYLVLAAHMMATSDVHRIRRRAIEQDEGQVALLVITVAAALVSLGAIIAELGPSSGSGGSRPPGPLLHAAFTIGLSWALVHTVFALHYAHEYYDDETGGGLAFPGGDAEPDYWDFVYFSFVIGMTSQVSDVAVTGKRCRRLVAAHGVVSFVFNVALLALTINLAASAL